MKLVVVFAILMVIACGQQQGSTSQQSPSAQFGASALPAGTPGAPLETLPPTSVPAATAQPVTFSGTGSKVTDPIHLALGLWRLSWKADGKSNFVIIGHGQETGLLVNVILPSPSSGEAAFTIVSGQIVLEIQADQASWTITLTRVSS